MAARPKKSFAQYADSEDGAPRTFQRASLTRLAERGIAPRRFFGIHDARRYRMQDGGEERKGNAVESDQEPSAADWAAEAESASRSLPRLRALLQGGEQRAAARDARRALAAAAAASAAAQLAALEASDVLEAGASARLRTLLPAAERAAARLALRREVEETAREAEEAAAEAATLQAQAEALVAELSDLSDDSASETEPMDTRLASTGQLRS